jgi:hypothetical protein
VAYRNGENAFAAVFVSQELSGATCQAAETIDRVDQDMETLQMFDSCKTLNNLFETN